MATQQQACAYAALILNEAGKTDAKSILAVTKAAGVDVSSGMAQAFSDALATINIAGVLGNMQFSSAPAGGAAPAAGGAAAPACKAAKEEVVEEEDDEMGFGLFD